MLKIDTEKNVRFSMMFIIIAVAMYIASRMSSDKFIELFAITSLKFTHVFPWRFITYCFYFGDSPIFFVFTILVLMVFATRLESIWGSFYFALFLIMTIVSRSLASFLFGAEVPIVDCMNVYTSLVIAFGFNFAEDRIYLFFFIPIKMKLFAIIALAMLGISMLNTLLYPLCIRFIQSYASMLPPEYGTFVDEYYHLQMFYQPGLIPVSPIISPFIVKVCSYVSLIVFAPKIFNFNKTSHFIDPKKEQLANAIDALNSKIKTYIRNKDDQKPAVQPDSSEEDEEDNGVLPDEDKNVCEQQHNGQPASADEEQSAVLCDEEDFDPNDNYCKTCSGYRRCAARSNMKTHQVDETV